MKTLVAAKKLFSEIGTVAAGLGGEDIEMADLRGGEDIEMADHLEGEDMELSDRARRS